MTIFKVQLEDICIDVRTMKEMFGDNFNQAWEIRSMEQMNEVNYRDENEIINNREKWPYLLKYMEKPECLHESWETKLVT